jgi:hypothetical protein
MPVRPMSAAQGDTLAPWVLRVGTATSCRAASRTRGCPGGQQVTSRGARAGPGMPAPPMPAFTSRPPPAGAPPKVPARRHRGVRPRPGQLHRPVGQGRRCRGRRRAAGTETPGRETPGWDCLPPADPRPPTPERPGHPRPAAPGEEPPGRPRPCRPRARPVVRHPGPCHRARAPGRPPPCRPRAAQRVAAAPSPEWPARPG